MQYFESKGGFANCNNISERQLLQQLEQEHFVEDKFLNLLTSKLNSDD